MTMMLQGASFKCETHLLLEKWQARPLDSPPFRENKIQLHWLSSYSALGFMWLWSPEKCLIIIICIPLFARSVRKARSNFYDNEAQGMQITEIKVDKGINTTLNYGTGILESEIRCCKTMWKEQVCQRNTETKN